MTIASQSLTGQDLADFNQLLRDARTADAQERPFTGNRERALLADVAVAMHAALNKSADPNIWANVAQEIKDQLL